VDRIETRSIIWESVKSRANFYADARMNGEVIRVLTSDQPAADAYYKSTLFAADEAFQGRCTARSTIFTASIAAGLMLTQFSRWLRGIPLDRDLTLNLLSSELTVS